MKKTFALSVLTLCAMTMTAQSIDFNMTGRNNDEVNEPGFVAWAVAQVPTEQKVLEGGITVNGNDQQLHKLVSTLVENAFKYVDDGGTINVNLAKTGKYAALEVRNTGSVISAEDLPHIFDRFYRTDKARTSGTGGFGLGLAIAREIARSHGGDITCTSTAADGTTFTVTLPVM